MTHDPRKRSERTDKQRPFPWRCPACGQKEVAAVTISYTAEVKHDGTLYTIQIPKMEIPTCGSCGEKVFSNSVDEQISKALRSHLRLLTPEQIRAAVDALGMRQKEVAGRLGVAEETLSRWVNGTVIQSRAMDNLLRAYFASPEVRTILLGPDQDPELGTTLVQVRS